MWLARATSIFDELGDDYGSVMTRVADATLAIAQGDVARAEAHVAVAGPLADRLGERFARSRLEYIRGLLADLHGDPQAAYGHVERSLRLADELGIHDAVMAQARLLVPLAHRAGEDGVAAGWSSFVQRRNPGAAGFDGSVVAAANNHAGIAARAAGGYGRAADAHRVALAWYRDARLLAGVSFSESCLGFLAAEQDDDDSARRHHAAALEAAIAADDDAALALAVEGVAAGLATHEPARATRLLAAATALWSSLPATIPTHRSDVERTAGVLRGALDTPALAAAVRDGAALDRPGLLAAARAAAQDAGSTLLDTD